MIPNCTPILGGQQKKHPNIWGTFGFNKHHFCCTELIWKNWPNLKIIATPGHSLWPFWDGEVTSNVWGWKTSQRITWHCWHFGLFQRLAPFWQSTGTSGVFWWLQVMVRPYLSVSGFFCTGNPSLKNAEKSRLMIICRNKICMYVLCILDI